MKKILTKIFCGIIAAASLVTLMACSEELDLTMDTEILEADDGKSITYKYTYVNIDEMPSSQKKQLEKQLNDDSTKTTLDDILVAARAEDPAFESITYAYYESDGELITSKTFE